MPSVWDIVGFSKAVGLLALSAEPAPSAEPDPSAEPAGGSGVREARCDKSVGAGSGVL